MEIWIGAEMDKEVGNDFRGARSKVESSINEFLVNRRYATDVTEWALIVILRKRIPEGWGEIAKFHRKTWVAEFRSIIDFQAFTRANANRQLLLIVRCLLQTFDKAPSIGVIDPGIANFKNDLTRFAAEKNWLGEKETGQATR